MLIITTLSDQNWEPQTKDSDKSRSLLPGEMYPIYYYLLHLAFLSPVIPYPLNSSCLPGNLSSTPGHPGSYVPEPAGRGTISLLWSCIITFALCIWAAIHPDIVHTNSPWSRTVYKLWWMLFAALVPEFVVCCALAQYRQAKCIEKLWREYWKDDEDKQRWLGMAGALFLVMGGYIVAPGPLKDSEGNSAEKGGGEEEKELVRTVSTAEFEALLQDTGETLRELIRSGVLNQSHFDRRNIEDKGKADRISKAVVCVQILWMVVQCVGRKVAGLPVTLLELHVLTQIPFAMVAYFCWWNKPLDVGVPIALPQEVVKLLELGKPQSVDSSCPCPPKFSGLKRKRKTSGGALSMFARASYDVGSNLDSKAELLATAMAVLQGALHCLAWEAYFPTAAERWVWLVSSFGMAVMPVTLYLLVSRFRIQTYVLRITYYLATAQSFSLKDMSGAYITAMRKEAESSYPPPTRTCTWTWPRQLRYWIRFLAFGACLLALGGYYFCIACVTLQAFISLRDLPNGAYKTAEFSKYLHLPHLG